MKVRNGIPQLFVGSLAVSRDSLRGIMAIKFLLRRPVRAHKRRTPADDDVRRMQSSGPTSTLHQSSRLFSQLEIVNKYISEMMRAYVASHIRSPGPVMADVISAPVVCGELGFDL